MNKQKELLVHGKNGTVFTEEDLIRLAEPYDRGEMPGEYGPITYGRPRLSDEETETFSFKLPASLLGKIRFAAYKLNMSASAFVREAAIEKLNSLL